MKFKISHTMAKASAVLVSSFMAGSAYAAAAAGDDLSSISTTLSGNIFSVGDVLSNASYVAGAGLTIAGTMKLKNAAQAPDQHPIGHAAGRLGAGALLLAAPWLVNSAMNTFSDNASAANTGITNTSGNRFQ